MIGQIINNTYRIEQKIGEGGMGAVYRGRDLVLDRDVAIKSLRPELAQQPDLLNRFREEARTLARLNHSNVTMIYSFLPLGDNHAMIMEFVSGKPLDEILQQCGALDVVTAARLFCQALEGVAHAHSLGIIHRDIKPANLLVTVDGQIKVTDFGIARVLGTARQTRTGRLIGTLEYMSPEQVRGQEADARSDVYALGILLYELVTGGVPFKSDSDYELIRAQVENDPPPPRDFNGDIPVAVELAIMRALAKDPASRFQSVNDFRAAIINAVPEAAVATEPIKLWDEPLIKETRQAFDLGEVFNQNSVSSYPIADDQTSQNNYDSRKNKLSVPAWFNRFDKRHYAAAAIVLLAVTIGVSQWNPKPDPVTPKPQPKPVVTPEPIAPSGLLPMPTVVPERVPDLPIPSLETSPIRSSQTRRERPGVLTTNTPVVKPQTPKARSDNYREYDRTAQVEEEQKREEKKSEDKKKKDEKSKSDKTLDLVKTGVGIWNAIKKKN